mmetsp:Transcript_3575/g.4188  ORF Transcript_3575/g.4188 Transcript_3575/m.4188 type:complete len:123 (+) Transcript_3575:24-392(+)
MYKDNQNPSPQYITQQIPISQPPIYGTPMMADPSYPPVYNDPYQQPGIIEVIQVNQPQNYGPQVVGMHVQTQAQMINEINQYPQAVNGAMEVDIARRKCYQKMGSVPMKCPFCRVDMSTKVR